MVGWISGHQQRGTFVHVCDIYLAWLCKGLGTDGWSSIEHDTTITPFHRHNDDLQGQSASSQTMPARSDCCRNTNNLGSCQCQRQRQRTEMQSDMQIARHLCSTPRAELCQGSNFGSPLTSWRIFLAVTVITGVTHTARRNAIGNRPSFAQRRERF